MSVLERALHKPMSLRAMARTTESSGYGAATLPGSPPLAWYAESVMPHSVTAPVGVQTVLPKTCVALGPWPKVEHPAGLP